MLFISQFLGEIDLLIKYDFFLVRNTKSKFFNPHPENNDVNFVSDQISRQSHTRLTQRPITKSRNVLFRQANKLRSISSWISSSFCRAKVKAAFKSWLD
ncbi:hypothetical protein RCL_jg1794.t1 [Rhizophagus clarus]|uniref:Uncharacterized protein n=1 Tax=Rhizophagus clarus TaxID=94130 RepID=A0A8H3L4Y1_9GLOM|nr:hypothetical protein RCL_jg1794.t1 [Rhizophagus clarus]